MIIIIAITIVKMKNNFVSFFIKFVKQEIVWPSILLTSSLVDLVMYAVGGTHAVGVMISSVPSTSSDY